MSVILTACRNAKQRNIEKALKARAKKQKAELRKKEENKRKKEIRRQRREEQIRQNGATEIDDLNPMANPVNIPDAPGYMDGEYEPATKIWTFLLDEEPFSIVFYKDTFDVFINGEETACMNNFPDDGRSDITVDFCVGAHKARISVTNDGNSAAVSQLLTIDGIPVPE